MNWPDEAKYCAHLFGWDDRGQAVERYRLFSETLLIQAYGYVRLRKSGGANHWWYHDAGSWWAKAHDRTFDCEERWAGVGLRA